MPEPLSSLPAGMVFYNSVVTNPGSITAHIQYFYCHGTLTALVGFYTF
jgi:hypothetical protein